MNRLANETSPYLLQHAHNPVEWYPWGAEAFERARRENKPVLVSVGYAACHWCHVMERESFEDPETARLMNERFVNVKVDREERPDVDALCMEAVISSTGRGGWPATVFLTPDGEAFHAGTYFPRVARRGLPALSDVLISVSDAYRSRRYRLLKDSGVQAVDERPAVDSEAENDESVEQVDRAARTLSRQFDGLHGGFLGPPKFFFSGALEFLLRMHRRTGEPRYQKMVTRTLRGLAHGGVYDQLGGGFHRYAVDASWVVPHFEKMLYDNALLTRLYLHAWMLTRDPLYRRVTEETLEHLLRDMRLPEGGFASALDADTNGTEGAFYCWKLSELRRLLPGELLDVAVRYYGVTAHGNFRGENVLHVASTELQRDERVEEIRRRLLSVRDERPRPARDDKVVAAWNGLVLAALAESGAGLQRPDLASAAEHLAEFILTNMTSGADLYRVWRAGTAKVRGYAEDYGAMTEGLLALYDSTGELRWLDFADRLARRAIELFHDPEGGAFFFAARDADPLVPRRKDLADHPTPSGNSTLAGALLRLSRLTGDDRLEDMARQVFDVSRSAIATHPVSQGYMLCALEFHLAPRRELAIIGPPGHPGTKALTRVARERFDPHLVLAFAAGEQDPATARLPLLAGKRLVGESPAAYLCEDFSCHAPVTDAEGLVTALEASSAERLPARDSR